ncbi:unnamed protein product, partial [Allacma fusca]
MGSSRQQVLWRLNMVLALSHAIFVYIRCIQIELEIIPVTKYQQFYMRFMAVCYSLGGLLHFGVIYKRTDIVALINKYMETIANFERRCAEGNA